jgi:CBS domain-containing protein
MKQTKEEYVSFEHLWAWRSRHMHHTQLTFAELNQLHDQLMKKIVRTAEALTQSEQGNPPARFAFLVMGSAGRKEQALWSDQDHALIHEGNEEDTPYFLALGKNITKGMEICGYERCEGKVMAEESRWCKPTSEMKTQVEQWIQEGSWESIRHLLILFDARTLVGDKKGNQELKELMFSYSRFRHSFRNRVLANTEFRMRRRNVFGQILTDKYNRFDFKETVLFPFVNAARTGAFIEGDISSSTISRMQGLSAVFPQMPVALKSFEHALDFRHWQTKNCSSYRDIHFIKAGTLSREEKRLVKEWMQEGKQLLEQVHEYYKNMERKLPL